MKPTYVIMKKTLVPSRIRDVDLEKCTATVGNIYDMLISVAYKARELSRAGDMKPGVSALLAAEDKDFDYKKYLGMVKKADAFLKKRKKNPRYVSSAI